MYRIASSVILLGTMSISAQIPDEAAWHSWILTADQSMRTGDFRAAERSLKAALEEARRLEPNLAPAATTYNNFGTLYQDMRMCNESASAYQRSLHLWEMAGPSSDPYFLRTASNLVGMYLECGNLEQAERHQRALVDPRFKELNRGDPEYAKVLTNLGSIQLLKHHYSEARALYEEGLMRWKQAAPEPSLEIVGLLNNLALSLLGTGESDQAIEYNRRAISMLESIGGLSNPMLVKLLSNGAKLLCSAQRCAEAEPILERTLTLARNVCGQDHPITAAVLLQYSEVLKSTKRKKEAAAMHRLAREIQANSFHSRQTIDIQELSRVK